MSDTIARFHEGPEGRKEWEAWMADQPESVREDWERYNEEHKDKFKSASQDKVAGHTHQWRHQIREEGFIHIDRTDILEMLLYCRKMLLQVPEYEKSLKELQANPRLFVTPHPNSRFKVRVGRYEYSLDRAARPYADLWSGFADALEAGGQRGLARSSTALAKSIPKTLSAMEKARETYSKHDMAYKPNYGAKVRAFERWIKGYKTLFARMFDTLEKIQDILPDQMDDVLVGFTEEEWAKLVPEAKKIVASASRVSPPIGVFGPAGTGAPEFSKEHIALNGDASEDMEAESFVLTRTSQPNAFEFCKTYQYPYDAVVVSILAAAKKIAPDALEVNSDGGPSAIKRVLGCEGGDPVFHEWINSQMASVTASWEEFKAPSGPAEGEVKSGLPGTEDEKVHKKAIRETGRERLSWDKEAAAGMYGYTKRTERDVQAAINRVKKRADQIARNVWSKDERTARFLQTHAERVDSLTAKILVSSMKEIGPRVASVLDGPWQETLSKEAAQHGLYGFRQKTARLGLQACTDLRDYFGQEAFNLHTRRVAKYDRITAFLKDHSKRGRCKFSRLLLKCYPSKDMKVASVDEPWLSWDE